MAVMVAKENVDAFIKASKEENLEATPVAEVTDDRRLVMYWRGKAIVDIKRISLIPTELSKIPMSWLPLLWKKSIICRDSKRG